LSSPFVPTRRGWIELGSGSVLGIVAVILLLFGVRDFRRALALRDAYVEYFRSAVPGEGRISVVNDALDLEPDSLALLRIKGAMYATKPTEARGAAGVFEAVKRLPGDDAEGRPRAAWGRLGLAVVALEQARRPAAPAAEREGSLAIAEKELAAARKELPKRAEAYALEGALALERGDLKACDAALDAAEKADGGATLGALLTLHTARAEAARRRGELDREVEERARAMLLAPARPELREALTRAVERRTADPRLAGDDAKKAITDARRLILPIEPMEHHRMAPAYGFDPRQVRAIKEAAAVAQAEQGDLESARGALLEAMREVPADGELSRQLGAIYAKQWAAETAPIPKKNLARLASDALRDAAQGKEVDPKDALESFLASAAFSKAAGDNDRALNMAERAAKIAPDDVRVDRALGVLYDSLARNKLAIDAYRRAIAKAPAEPVSVEMEARMKALEAKGDR
jgi:hypothetical protein